MIETIVTLGILAAIIPIMIYNSRAIAELKTKIDFIYNNIKVTMEFIKDNNK